MAFPWPSWASRTVAVTKLLFTVAFAIVYLFTGAGATYLFRKRYIVRR